MSLFEREIWVRLRSDSYSVLGTLVLLPANSSIQKQQPLTRQSIRSLHALCRRSHR